MKKPERCRTARAEKRRTHQEGTELTVSNVTAAAVIAAAVLLTGCSTDQTGEAAGLAREACGVIGTPGNTTYVPTGEGTDPADANKDTDVMDNVADLAAKAAVRDPRWNDLADAMSSLASQIAQVQALVEQTGQRTVAPDQVAWASAVNTVYSECRKAHAAD